ncbi:LDLR chaperone boca [Solenopsis invicta]|uniref:LDLR chaperone boca n=1 Tax=Solenopsis invicta TaxID=13686 RepID=UPI0005959430|nr:LDLR chaperone boca [Solenopsis invicta]XP_039312666.1 LDLR chaperone boca [Solenopsis invicta]
MIFSWSRKMESRIIVLGLFVFLIAMAITVAKEQKKKSWRDKDIRDMTDADLEHLLEQWEENEEPLEPDELPEHLRPAPKIDVSKLDLKNPENVLKITKKGKSVMMFVNIQSKVSEDQADLASRIWQTGLQNNHITVERYPIENKRYIFMFHDGAQAVEGKNFLLQQSEIESITIDGQTYHPKGQNFVVDESLKKPSAKKNEL